MGEWLNSAFILRARATGLELKGQVVRVPLGPAPAHHHPQQQQQQHQQQQQEPSSPSTASAAAAQHSGASGPVQSGEQEEPRGSGNLPAAGSCPFAAAMGRLQPPAGASSPRGGDGGGGDGRLTSPGAGSAGGGGRVWESGGDDRLDPPGAASAGAGVGGREWDGGGCSGDGGRPVGLLFMGSVRLEGLEAMRQAGLFVSDIPLHDLNRDFVLAAEQVAAEAQLRERYEALSLELQVRAWVVVCCVRVDFSCRDGASGPASLGWHRGRLRGINRSICCTRTGHTDIHLSACRCHVAPCSCTAQCSRHGPCGSHALPSTSPRATVRQRAAQPRHPMAGGGAAAGRQAAVPDAAAGSGHVPQAGGEPPGKGAPGGGLGCRATPGAGVTAATGNTTAPAAMQRGKLQQQLTSLPCRV